MSLQKKNEFYFDYIENFKLTNLIIHKYTSETFILYLAFLIV